MQIIRNVNVCITNFVWRKDDWGMQYLKLFLADLLGSWHFHIKSFQKFFSRCYKMAIWIRKVFMSCFFYVTLKKYRGLFWLPLKIVTNDGTKRKSNISSDLLSVPSSLSSPPYCKVHRHTEEHLLRNILWSYNASRFNTGSFICFKNK